MQHIYRSKAELIKQTQGCR